ncbi:hypothetical protein ACWDOP_15105 [Nocardia sp. NPDC003693]
MIRRLVVLATVPRWVVAVAVVAAPVGFLFVVVVLAFGGMNSEVSADLRYQCDSAVGPDPSGSPVTAHRATASARTAVVTAPPSVNPYARLTTPSIASELSGWERACVAAMASAPYQLPPLSTPNTGVAADCARKIAVNLAAQSATITGSRPIDQGALAAVVIPRASAAALGAGCTPLPGADSGDIAALLDENLDSAGRATPGCGSATSTGPLRLPNTAAAQSICGQRVDPAAVSPGDLVFWDYRGYSPARAGVAVGAGQLVTCDPSTGYVVLSDLPGRADVRVKRVLGGGR